MMFLGMISSASSGVELLAAHAVAQSDGDGALRVLLADDMLVELSHNLARRQIIQRKLFFFGSCREINSHKFSRRSSVESSERLATDDFHYQAPQS